MSLETSAQAIARTGNVFAPSFVVQSMEQRSAMDRISSIEVDISRDKSNDTCIVTCEKTFRPYKLFEPVCVDYPVHDPIIHFQGVCTRIEVQDNLAQYTIASPSILLSRNECKVTFIENTRVSEILRVILPSGFVFRTSVDNRLFKSNTFIGKMIMSALEEIAEYFKLKLYVYGWKVYIDEEFPTEGSIMHSFTDDEVRNITYELYGGSDVYTKVLGRAIVDNSACDGKKAELMIYEEDVFESSVDLVDVLTVEDNAYVHTTDDLRNAVHKRVLEIREASLTKDVELVGLTDVRPLDKAYIGGTLYEVVAVKHYAEVGNERTVMTVCEA